METSLAKTSPKKKTSSRKKFNPPSTEQVHKYAQSIDFPGLDADHFIAYYEARGWTLGKGQKMKSWKAAVRTWKCNAKQREREKAEPPPWKVRERQEREKFIEVFGQVGGKKNGK